MVTLIRHDLEFILNQIKISERHAAGERLVDILPNTELGWGLRTVDGSENNLLPGRTDFGAADTLFPRGTHPFYLNDLDGDQISFGPGLTLTNTNYGVHAANTSTNPRAIQPGDVVDADPRLISNLIVDQSARNPAAVLAADGATELSPGADGVFGTPDDVTVNFIANVAPDEGLSAPFNGWMTLFGQFFDHGLDLVAKGGYGTVYIPLQPDDPLYVPGGRSNFMVVTRATVTQTAGRDGQMNTADDGWEATNLTTPWVDQNQTYTSHPSMQVFHREYALVAGKPMATGRLLDGKGPDGVHGTADDGGIATWAEIKEQARTMLGIALDDQDVLNGPLLATDQYGNFLRGPNGLPQLVTANGLVEGNLATPVDASLALRTGHAFLDDIAHNANPAGKTQADADSAVGLAPGAPATAYDNELLDAHYITGDGRGNENIGLTAVHHVFHSEHNRQVAQIKQTILATNDPVFIKEWLLPGATIENGVQESEWNGERLFQAAKFPTEMQYQHLVFEEFARKVQPLVNVFNDYDATIDPTILAEFAHTVYRFGHSMLTETVDRYDPDWTVTNGGAEQQQIGLIAAFLNPLEFAASGVNADAAAGAIARGMTRQQGAEIDEFVTEALRSNLVGLPLDLAAINIARGRELGVPSLNQARREFFAGTQDSQLKPYTSWVDFALNVKNPASVINFIAAYGTHQSITSASTLEGKRAAATAIVIGGDDAPADRFDFLNSTGAWANTANGVTITGLDAVDFWIGGLAEKKMVFGGMLGSTFNFVFETQLENLQNADRFYYLSRLAGLNLTAQLENNKFSEMIHRNTNATHLPGDAFATPNFFLEVDQTKQFNAGLGSDDPVDASNPFVPLVIRAPGFLQFTGGDHVVLGGTNGNDTLIGGLGDDTLWGDGGDDVIEGGDGNDFHFGGEGDDIHTDLYGVDEFRTGAGDDAVNGGGFDDLIIGDTGQDWLEGGEDLDEILAGQDNDFLNGGDGEDMLIGGEGDDWIENGSENGLLLGDNGDLIQGLPIKTSVSSTIIGNDVLYGEGNTDHDAESGDDIMVSGQGTDRFFGQRGFDWVTHKDLPSGIEADMNVRLFAPPPAPGSAAAILDRYAETEAMSGTEFNDILRGDDAGQADLADHQLTNIALIRGLQEFLGAGVTLFDRGNILLGGDGSDIIEGRGGDDIIDGDRWLNVRIAVTAPDDPSVELFSVDRMGELSARIFSGEIDPGQLRIVREILRADGSNDLDTALFSGLIAEYQIEGFDGNRAFDVNEDGFISVAHRDAAGVAGAGADGTDLLSGIERFQFVDRLIVNGGRPNAPATGLATISGPAAEGSLLRISIENVRDGDNPNGGVVSLEDVVVTWQVDLLGDGVFTDIVRDLLGEQFPVRGLTFRPTQDEVGLAVRARIEFADARGTPEQVFSTPTGLIADVNQAPTGLPTLSDLTPTQGVALTAVTTAIADGDGIPPNAFAFQWQARATPTAAWVNIAGATAASFTPGAAQTGQQLRVVVSYRDGGGVNEQVISAPSGVVGINVTLTGGNDTRVGTEGDDIINGEGGNDVLSGLGGDDALNGGAGGDTLNGGEGNDTLRGDGGGDTLDGGVGADVMFGGTGDDTYVVDNAGDAVIEGAGEGTDTVRTAFQSFTLGTNVENLTFIGAGAFTGIGNALANTIIGGAGADVLDGLAGNDRMEGGQGDDTYYVNVTGDTVVEGANAGVDTIIASFAGSTTLTIANNVENFTQTGAGAVNVSGNGAANRITGGAAVDSLSGLAGNDVLLGGGGGDTLNGGGDNDTLNGEAGDDTLIGGTGSDIFQFGLNAGNDRILDFDGNPNGGQDRIDLSAIVTAAQFASAVTISAVNGGQARVSFAGGSVLVNVAGGAGALGPDDFLLG